MDANSDDELALLEQLEQAKRLQAQLEAKLAAKKRKVQAGIQEKEKELEQATGFAREEQNNTVKSDLPPVINVASTLPTARETTRSRSRAGAGTSIPPTTSQSVTTTPPMVTSSTSSAAGPSAVNNLTPESHLLKATPASPPRFRTPSPRGINPFFISPPSGAMSRKRQHSPSPLPGSARRLSHTPSGLTPTAAAGAGGGRSSSSMLSPSQGRTRYGRVVDMASIKKVARDFPSELMAVTQAEAESRTKEAEKAMAAARAAARAKPAVKDETIVVETKAITRDDGMVKGTAATTATGEVENEELVAKDDQDFAAEQDDLPLLEGEDLDAFVNQLNMPFDSDDEDPSMEEEGKTKEESRIPVQQRSRDEASGPESESKSRKELNDTLTDATTDAASVVGIDSLTGLRLRTRSLQQKELDAKLESHAHFALKDTEGIRKVGQRQSGSGLLPSTRPGRLDLTSSSTTITSITATSNNITNTTITSSSERLTISTAAAKLGQQNPEWVIAGVVAAKSKPRTTAKNVRYFHFQLSDLQNHEINVFLFRNVMDRHYNELCVGQVVALLTPKLLSQTDRLGTIGVEVDSVDKLVVIGMGSDIGFCEAVKLNGSDCGKALDRRSGLYCTFHIQLAANRLRSKRGALLASTSSTFDLNQSEQLRMQQILKGGGGYGSTGGYFNKVKLSSSGGGDHGSSALQQARRIRNMDGRDTTYIFDDGAVGSSSLTEPTTPRKRKQQNDGEDALTSFLMNQDNPGGMYLRQAMASKEVAWAKDITSPKSPAGKGVSGSGTIGGNDAVLFPPDMIRRMGYDPVSGRFVPGSPKRRENDDPEARERSIRMLTERIKSPPARPILVVDRSGSSAHTAVTTPVDKTKTPRGRRQVVAGDVFFSDESTKKNKMENGAGSGVKAGPSSTSSSLTPTAKRWVILSDGGSSGSSDDEPSYGPDGSPMLSFSAQRDKNLREASKARAAMIAAGGVEGQTSQISGLLSPEGRRRIHASPAKSMTATQNRAGEQKSPFLTSSSATTLTHASKTRPSPFLTRPGTSSLPAGSKIKSRSSSVTVPVTTASNSSARSMPSSSSSRDAPKESTIPQPTSASNTITPASSSPFTHQSPLPRSTGATPQKFVSLSDSDSD